MDYAYIWVRIYRFKDGHEMLVSYRNTWVYIHSGVVDVEADEETGEYEILQAVNCHDTGKVLYYDGARGQMIGDNNGL